MAKTTTIIFILTFISQFGLFINATDSKTYETETGKQKGFDVIFVVDVSPHIKEKDYVNLLENVVKTARISFRDCSEERIDFRLITFNNRAELLPDINSDQKTMITEIKRKLSDISPPAYLERGLGKIFDLVAENFPQKVGVVIFISNGGYNKLNLRHARDELKRTIRALENNGFTVFSIFLASGKNRCKECMVMISEWANTHFYEIRSHADVRSNMKRVADEALRIRYSSPVKRQEYNKIKNSLGKAEKLINEKNRDIVRLMSQLKVKEDERYGKNPDWSIQKYPIESPEKKSSGSNAWLIVLILFTALSIVAFILYKKNRFPFRHYLFEKRSSFRRIPEIDPQVFIELSGRNSGKVESWLPEYPAACRCKNRIDIREIVAFEHIEIIRSRKKGSAVKWLDLCCGNGNILAEVGKSLGEGVKRIEYYGYDLDKSNIDQCQHIIFNEKLSRSLAKIKVDVVNLDASPIPGRELFDFITLLNVLHEIDPSRIFALLKNALERCRKNGMILIVDMLSLPHLEWKAITWSIDNLKDLMAYFVKEKSAIVLNRSMNIPVYQRSVDVFSLKLYRQDIDECVFRDWHSKKEEKKRKAILFRCLEKKKESLSHQLHKVYYERDKIIAAPENLETNVKKVLWEYWAVCESLLGFKGIK